MLRKPSDLELKPSFAYCILHLNRMLTESKRLTTIIRTDKLYWRLHLMIKMLAQRNKY